MCSMSGLRSCSPGVRGVVPVGCVMVDGAGGDLSRGRRGPGAVSEI